MNPPSVTALVVVHNEAHQLADCLSRLSFAHELVVVLDRCTDESADIARRFGARLIEGAWEREGDRRNGAIAACTGPWILEVDADERVSPELAAEILAVTAHSTADWHLIGVDNYIGDRLVRWGWGANIGKSAYPGLFRQGAKLWGNQHIHPKLRFTGRAGPVLTQRITHLVDRNISDLIQRVDRYTTAQARDLRESGAIGTFRDNFRRIFSRFWKCYVARRGYREGQYGFLLALCAAIYPMLAYLKANLERD